MYIVGLKRVYSSYSGVSISVLLNRSFIFSYYSGAVGGKSYVECSIKKTIIKDIGPDFIGCKTHSIYFDIVKHEYVYKY